MVLDAGQVEMFKYVVHLSLDLAIVKGQVVLGAGQVEMF